MDIIYITKERIKLQCRNKNLIACVNICTTRLEPPQILKNFLAYCELSPVRFMSKHRTMTLCHYTTYLKIKLQVFKVFVFYLKAFVTDVKYITKRSVEIN